MIDLSPRQGAYNYNYNYKANNNDRKFKLKQLIELLISKGADINAIDIFYQKIMIFFSSEKCNID